MHLATAGLISLASLTPQEPPRPARAVIERCVDASIQMHGPWAPVRLPLDKGVKVWNPTAVVVGPGGRIYAANYTGEIYSLSDTDGDGLEDTTTLFCDVKKDKLRYPTCMAFRGRDLYVGTTQEIRIYTDTNGDGVADKSRTFFKDFPWTLHFFDWTLGLCFGPDGHVYASLCTDYLNKEPAPDPKGYRGALLRISPDGKRATRIATGLRFAYGFAFNAHGDLFFTDNEGGGNPQDELNLVKPGAFYGHNVKKYPDHPPTTEPVLTFQHGVGPGGMEFNSKDNDFGGTAGDAFVALWGPDWFWNRGSVVRVRLRRDAKGAWQATESPIATSFGKIVDLTFGPRGDLYVAKYGREIGRGHRPNRVPSGAIYRLIHAPWFRPNAVGARLLPVAGDKKNGKQLFAKLACANCHDAEGNRQMIGPSLRDVKRMYNRGEFLAVVRDPSQGIKSGHEAFTIKLKDGTESVGRLLHTDTEKITLLTVENKEVVLAREKIESVVPLETSIMPPGLLGSLEPSEVDDMLAYLGVGKKLTWRGLVLDHENLAPRGKASSPDGHDLAGGAQSDQAAVDRDPTTFWEEVPKQKEYRLRLGFDRPITVTAMSLAGFAADKRAPKDFELFCDGEKVATVKNAIYNRNRLLKDIPLTTARVFDLVIHASYGKTSAIREWGLYDLRSARPARHRAEFFAFDNGLPRGTPDEQMQLLAKLGYSGVGTVRPGAVAGYRRAAAARGLKLFSLYATISPGKNPAYHKRLEADIALLKGTSARIWLAVQRGGTDADAVRHVKRLADLARTAGLRVVLYPHHGFRISTIRDAARFAKSVGRDNVGLSLNLCHVLRAGNGTKLDELLREFTPRLDLVSINGTDSTGDEWRQLIRPLGRGTFDMRAFLRKLRGAGYRGPIGLQCYGVPGDRRTNLAASIEAWRRYRD